MDAHVDGVVVVGVVEGVVPLQIEATAATMRLHHGSVACFAPGRDVGMQRFLA
jgi:hypothetical protein